jgi:hypothetical protein
LPSDVRANKTEVETLVATRNFPVGAISALMGACANDSSGIAAAINKIANNKYRRINPPAICLHHHASEYTDLFATGPGSHDCARFIFLLNELSTKFYRGAVTTPD